ncbi:sel1 repeat family protein [Bordetella petrii]|uniref:sel1 repeat family protein n=1 Tax=Bordetella petrii TaxID=94624 RepID=UPI00372FED48
MTNDPRKPAPVSRHGPPIAARLGPWLAACVLCLAVALSSQAAKAPDVTPEQAYQLALEARTARDYAAMLAFLRQAGEAGELAAQEMLGSVLLAGPALYGDAVPADPCEAALWVRRAAAQGSAVGRHQRDILNGMRDLPGGRAACAAPPPA